ncbi:MAG: metalloregulator ArsR/SmtB family transcription factor [Kiritimatiellae bacterium]|nr:metalloregulator ArsR/SmtB family transcription factor [Kiritimatiellia bacterium]
MYYEEVRPNARIFKALSEVPRLRILALLTSGELCVCDLMAALRLPQSTVSRHLAYLRNSGLVSDHRRGAWMFYQLAIPTGDMESLIRRIPLLLSRTDKGRSDQLLLQSHLRRSASNRCC